MPCAAALSVLFLMAESWTRQRMHGMVPSCGTGHRRPAITKSESPLSEARSGYGLAGRLSLCGHSSCLQSRKSIGFLMLPFQPTWTLQLRGWGFGLARELSSVLVGTATQKSLEPLGTPEAEVLRPFAALLMSDPLSGLCCQLGLLLCFGPRQILAPRMCNMKALHNKYHATFMKHC